MFQKGIHSFLKNDDVITLMQVFLCSSFCVQNTYLCAKFECHDVIKKEIIEK